MKILIVGISGRMGSVLFNELKSKRKNYEVRGVDVKNNSLVAITYNNFDFTDFRPDVIIDFSSRSALNDCLDFALKNKTNCVFLATDYRHKDIEKIKEYAKHIAILQTSNASIAVNLLASLIKTAENVLKNAKITITETHHIHKKDAPSGTALYLNEALGGTGEIKSVRRGETIGIHEVSFENEFDNLTFTHTAKNRKLFADGAVSCAEFIYKKDNGLYSMQDVVKGITND